MAGSADMRPGDEVPPDNDLGAANVCPHCSGSGEDDRGRCEFCAGTGEIQEAVGGG